MALLRNKIEKPLELEAVPLEKDLMEFKTSSLETNGTVIGPECAGKREIIPSIEDVLNSIKLFSKGTDSSSSGFSIYF